MGARVGKGWTARRWVAAVGGARDRRHDGWAATDGRARDRRHDGWAATDGGRGIGGTTDGRPRTGGEGSAARRMGGHGWAATDKQGEEVGGRGPLPSESRFAPRAAAPPPSRGAAETAQAWARSCGTRAACGPARPRKALPAALRSPPGRARPRPPRPRRPRPARPPPSRPPRAHRNPAAAPHTRAPPEAPPAPAP